MIDVYTAERKASLRSMRRALSWKAAAWWIAGGVLAFVFCVLSAAMA